MCKNSIYRPTKKPLGLNEKYYVITVLLVTISIPLGLHVTIVRDSIIILLEKP